MIQECNMNKNLFAQSLIKLLSGYIPVIAKRINNEEQVLEQGLEGYKEYKQKVKYKVLPGIW